MFRQLNLVNRVIIRSRSIAFASTTAPKIKAFPLITCKNTKFNLLAEENQNDSKIKDSNTLELASKGWQHYKAKGDHFIIHPVRDVIESNLKNSVDLSELELDETLVKNIYEKHGIKKATKLQKDAIDEILQGKHVLIAAETGCGKTHAYLIPIIQQLIARKARETQERQFNTPLALIITPGRELAHQIGRVAEELTDGLGMNVKVIVGGHTKQVMRNPEFEDIDILVGSIGALSKLTTTGIFRMTAVKHVVLDEADTLLDDSFNEKLCHYLHRFSFIRDVQLVLASATMPTNTEDVFRDIIDTDTLTKVVSTDLHKILPYVTQKFIRMNKSQRAETLLRIVKSEVQKKRPVIVFSTKSSTSDYVSIFLNDNGINCLNLNGDMLKKIRDGRFDKFQNGEVNVLSTTDCIGRGLNTVRARHIVNFEFPIHISDYIHRCGRIGRLGSDKSCFITNFISSEFELDLVRKIETSARTTGMLEDVNANINKIITEKIQRTIQRYENIELHQMSRAAKENK